MTRSPLGPLRSGGIDFPSHSVNKAPWQEGGFPVSYCDFRQANPLSCHLGKEEHWFLDASADWKARMSIVVMKFGGTSLADADKIRAQIDLLKFYIDHAQLKTPINGKLVAGDLKRQIGAPVKLGDILFEVTPLDTLRAQILVSEDQILDIKTGQSGRLATVSFPDQKIPFVVERVSPMAEVVNNRNVFKVRVQLQDTRDWMRPGMEGVAKIDIEKRRYIWIWTRKLVNWVRLKFWF